MDINSLISDKATVKTLEFILGMAKDSHFRQIRERDKSKFERISGICEYYQDINLQEAKKIINTIKKYQEENK